jgi:putative transposase
MIASHLMAAVLSLLISTLLISFRSRLVLQAEILALHHQIAVLKRTSKKRLSLRPIDRILWVWLSCFWSDWYSSLVFVKPETTVRWHQSGFRLYWKWKSARRGRPETGQEIRQLIGKMSSANATWGAPRILGELLKLRIQVSQATVAKYMLRQPKPPSQTWRTFLKNRSHQLASIDFFTVPTLTFRILFVFVVLSHQRRRVVHFSVTEHPTEEWTSRQLVQAFPFDTVARNLLRDRDRIYSPDVRQRLTDMGITEVLTAPRPPWQTPYVECLIGSIRRDCLD